MSIGPLMLDLEGKTLTSDEQSLLARPAVGAVIFFSRNYQSIEQLVRLVAEIRAVRPELLICVDQEGGRVQRFREGFTRIPPMQTLGNVLALHRESEEFIKDTGWLLAAELIACDIDFSFTPVLDVDRNYCEVIADRSFSDDPQIVTRAARAFIAGMKEAGMAATGKHFPGHGGVAVDSHLATPYDSRSMQELRQKDLLPFQALLPDLAAVMPAHMVYPNIHPDSVGFSQFWLQEILRGEMGFDGVIFSDDLSMKGADIAGGYVEKAESAISAGCDMVLVCNNRAGALQVLEYLETRQQPDNQRLSAMKASRQMTWSEVTADPRWKRTRKALDQLTCD